MATIYKVDPDEPIDVAIRKFNRLVAEDMILDKVREKRHYVKPSRRRYEKKKELKRSKTRTNEQP